MEKQPVLLKVEIPFCVHPCDSCNHAVIAGWDTQRMVRYMQAVIREILANADQFEDCQVKAIRYGGGVASNAGPTIADAAKAIRESFDIAEDVSVTMRTAVSNISGAAFPYFRRAGVQRFDMEMMSVFQPMFSQFNHNDNFNDFAIACDSFLHSYANDSLGLNLLFGHEGIGNLDFRRSCIGAADTHASHIVFMEAAGGVRADDETIAYHVAQMHEILEPMGFVEYLPLHFAREGREDAFARGLADGMDVLSFGLGAKTKFEGVISANTSDFETYVEYSSDFKRITASVDRLNG